jgi:hypothetical protein
MVAGTKISSTLRQPGRSGLGLGIFHTHLWIGERELRKRKGWKFFKEMITPKRAGILESDSGEKSRLGGLDLVTSLNLRVFI